jgi:chorismate mutase / prephenate dehydratase
MPDTTPDTSDPAGDPATALAALRAELDRIDDDIHDLLMRRAEVIERVAATGAKGRVPFRAGREAEIVHRLLARHHGPLPRRVLPRIWREMLAATTAMQADYVIAVCDPSEGQTAGYVSLGREHFGASTDMRIHSSPAQALADVSSGAAIAAVLPMPSEDEPPRAAWWTALLQQDAPRIHVVARLPFWAPRAEGASQSRALVVSVVPPDASPADHTLIGLELPPETSRARVAALFTDAGLPPLGLILRRDQHASLVLVDVDGFVAETDPRLASLDVPHKPVVIGAYAKPVGGESA